ncbi:hypothetical protein GMRT_11517 [Giardia muris]|uniref:Importin N-terminal domain-containing protein n=1 Tax=Giardia muris TaxID=5742 RepID=A0A4Z1SNG3_GIAMU|nr:hypothetical protein GMRT_11517 [Giardia muris]|eukprot:TNJ27314.1 hypothetical protein GMRT_11517 [Giardia muris]
MGGSEEDLAMLFASTLQSDQAAVTAATERILVLKRRDNFISLAYQVAANPQQPIAVRTAAAIQFSKTLADKLKDLPADMIGSIAVGVMRTAVEAAGCNGLGITRQMLEALASILEYVSLSYHAMVGMSIEAFVRGVYAEITSLVDGSSMAKIDVCIQMITILLQNATAESLRELHMEVASGFYNGCLYQLLQYLYGLPGDFTGFAISSLLEHIFACIHSFFTYSSTQAIVTSQAFETLIPVICLMLGKIGAGLGDTELRNAKDHALRILLQLASTHRYGARSSDGSVSPFLKVWLDNEETIGQIVLREFENCVNYDLWEDHVALESLFRLSCKLIESSATSGPYSPRAYALLFEHSEFILNNLLRMIYNAGELRIDRFDDSDLLVIDCLKHCMDFIAQFTLQLPSLAASVQREMECRINPLIEGDPQFVMSLATKDAQIQLFVGIILLRRGPGQSNFLTKGKVIFSALSMYQSLNPIVFEELAKLIINVTTEDVPQLVPFQENVTEYVGNLHELFTTTLQSGIKRIEAQDDFVSDLVYLLGCLYLLPETSFFQCRMLSGILARCVRNNMINMCNQRHLLLRSLFLIAGAQEQSAAGGMVTFCRVAFPGIPPEDGNFIVKHFLELPEIVAISTRPTTADAQQRKLAESVLETVMLVVTNISAISLDFEVTIVRLAFEYMAKDIRLSRSGFTLVNTMIRKFNESQPSYELLGQCFGFIDTYIAKFYARPMDYIFSNASHVEDMVADALPYLCVLISRLGMQEHSLTTLEPIISVIVALLRPRNSVVFICIGSFLLTRLLGEVATANVLRSQVFETCGPLLTAIVNDLVGTCNGLMTHNLVPDLKRCMMTAISIAYMTLLHTAHEQGAVQPLLQGTNPFGLKVVFFMAAWGIQDNEGNPYAPLRGWLANVTCYVADSLVELLKSDPSYTPVIVPLLTWAYILSVSWQNPHSLQSSHYPQLGFEHICNSGADMNALVVVLSNMNSDFTRFTTFSREKLLPLYEGFDSTPLRSFFELLPRQLLGEIRSVHLVSADSKQGNLRQALEQIDRGHLGDDFGQYLLSELGVGSGASLLQQNIANMRI